MSFITDGASLYFLLVAISSKWEVRPAKPKHQQNRLLNQKVFKTVLNFPSHPLPLVRDHTAQPVPPRGNGDTSLSTTFCLLLPESDPL